MVYISSIKNMKVMLAGSCLLFSASCVVAEEAPALVNTTTTTVTTTTATSVELTQAQKDAQAAANEVLAAADSKISTAASMVAFAKTETAGLKNFKFTGTELVALQELDQLSAILKTVVSSGRLANLVAAKKSLLEGDESAKQKLQKAKENLDKQIGEDTNHPLKKLQVKVTAKLEEVEGQAKANDDEKQARETALKALYTTLASLPNGIRSSVDSLPQQSNAEAPSLLKNQTKHMQQLEQMLRLRHGFSQRWNGDGGFGSLQTLLDTAASTLSTDERAVLKVKIVTALTAANGAIKQKCGHVGSWFDTLKDHCGEKAAELLTKHTQLHQGGLSAENRLGAGREARLLVSDGRPMMAALAGIIEWWPGLAVQMEEKGAERSWIWQALPLLIRQMQCIGRFLFSPFPAPVIPRRCRNIGVPG